MPFTVYLANKMLTQLGTSVYVTLHLGDPGPSGTANPSAVTTRGAATLSAPTNGTVTLSGDVTWSMTAREQISHIAVWDASTGGHCMLTDQLDEAKNVFTGDTFDLPTLTVQIPAAA